jgi:hypothetical protein
MYRPTNILCHFGELPILARRRAPLLKMSEGVTIIPYICCVEHLGWETAEFCGGMVATTRFGLSRLHRPDLFAASTWPLSRPIPVVRGFVGAEEKPEVQWAVLPVPCVLADTPPVPDTPATEECQDTSNTWRVSCSDLITHAACCCLIAAL